MPQPLQLREMTEADLPIFFEHLQDPAARHMAAFTAPNPGDRQAFQEKWAAIVADASLKRTILWDGRPVGYVNSFLRQGKLEVCYWIEQAHWGKGVATGALTEFL